MGRVLDNGYLQIVGRQKNLLNISSSEERSMRCPGVANGVIGIASDWRSGTAVAV
jgi:hypothetical protein